jgi:hypothetical protein
VIQIEKFAQTHAANSCEFLGLILLAGLAPLAPVVQPLTFAMAANLVLVIVAVWETRSLRPAWADAAAGELSSAKPS